jgi:hypothetical protein
MLSPFGVIHPTANKMPILFLILLFWAFAFSLKAEDWTTTDGNTYNDVKIISVDGDTVTITDQNGHDFVSMKALAPKFQREVRYFVAKAKGTNMPDYFPVSAVAQVEALAKQLGLPLAWIDSLPSDFSAVNPDTDSEEELTQRTVKHLKGQAVVIFLDDDKEGQPPLVHDQLEIFDDGPLSGGYHFLGPKIIFSNVDATKIYGRVSATQLRATGEAAIDKVLASIP